VDKEVVTRCKLANVELQRQKLKKPQPKKPAKPAPLFNGKGKVAPPKTLKAAAQQMFNKVKAGAKTVGKAVVQGVKNVGKAVAKAPQKIVQGVKSLFKKPQSPAKRPGQVAQPLLKKKKSKSAEALALVKRFGVSGCESKLKPKLKRRCGRRGQKCVKKGAQKCRNSDKVCGAHFKQCKAKSRACKAAVKGKAAQLCLGNSKHPEALTLLKLPGGVPLCRAKLANTLAADCKPNMVACLRKHVAKCRHHPQWKRALGGAVPKKFGKQQLQKVL